MKNTIRRAALVAGTDTITPADILLEHMECEPGSVPGRAPVDEAQMNAILDGSLSLKEIANKVASGIEKEVIMKTLQKTGGNKSRAAKLLKIERVTLYAKMKDFQIEI